MVEVIAFCFLLWIIGEWADYLDSQEDAQRNRYEERP